MGVYIKNLEMPKKCESCPFFEAVSCEEDSKDYRCARTGLYVFPKEKSIHCPLVEVKPHGRLIDADELMLKIQDYIEEYSPTNEHGMHDLKWCAMKEAEMAINAAPTIVEADNNTQNMRDESEGEDG